MVFDLIKNMFELHKSNAIENVSDSLSQFIQLGRMVETYSVFFFFHPNIYVYKM